MLVAAALGACGGGGPAASPDAGPVDAISIVPGAYRAEPLSLTDLADGDSIDLDFPPQGGFVLFVGVRVRGLGGRVAEVRGRVRDPATGVLLAEDARTVRFDPSPGDPALLEPDLRSYTNVSNIAVCPLSPPRDLVDRVQRLEVEVIDPASGRRATVARSVTPRCRQKEATIGALCRCECAATFTVGGCR